MDSEGTVVSMSDWRPRRAPGAGSDLGDGGCRPPHELPEDDGGFPACRVLSFNLPDQGDPTPGSAA